MCAGRVAEEDPRPVQSDTLFNVFSVSKGVAAAVVHTMVDCGEVALDDTIVSHWAAFAPAHSEKARTTVAHALAHQVIRRDPQTERGSAMKTTLLCVLLFHEHSLKTSATNVSTCIGPQPLCIAPGMRGTYSPAPNRHEGAVLPCPQQA